MEAATLGIGAAMLMGLAFGAGPCNITCLPYLGPVLMGSNGSWRIVVPFSAGRLFSYAIVGAVAGGDGRDLHATGASGNLDRAGHLGRLGIPFSGVGEMVAGAGDRRDALRLVGVLRAGPETPQLFARWFDVTLLMGQEDAACDRLIAMPHLAPDYGARIFCTARAIPIAPAKEDPELMERAFGDTAAALAAGNAAYHARHGFIFIVFASGKSAAEMLALLEQRLPRSTAEEMQTAAAEQMKITELRLSARLDATLDS